MAYMDTLRCEAHNQKNPKISEVSHHPAALSNVPWIAGIMALFPGMVMRIFVSLGRLCKKRRGGGSPIPQKMVRLAGSKLPKTWQISWGSGKLHRFIWFE